MKLDYYLPHYDFFSRHRILINSTPDIIFNAIQNLNFNQSQIIRCLLTVRKAYAVLGFDKSSWSVEKSVFNKKIIESGFTVLDYLPGREIVLGFAGQFWKPSGGFINFSNQEEYLAYTATNACKGAWNFYLSETGQGTLELSTETRVFCPEKAVKQKFGLYWLFIKPFSGLIRKVLLKNIKHIAERSNQV